MGHLVTRWHQTGVVLFPGVRACVFGAGTRRATPRWGDHLSSVLSCTVRGIVLALHDTKGFYIFFISLYIGGSKKKKDTSLEPNQFLCIKFAVVNAGF